jgi:membrane-bound hydrogenase subunit beta
MSDKTPRGTVGDIDAIAAGVRAAFALPEGAVRVQRATRLWIDVDQAGFAGLFDHLVKEQGFRILCTITGLDLGAELGFIYHLARDGGIMANVKTRCPKGTAIRSVTPYFPGAANYESELEDLLGARVEGLPKGPRYPLPENWPAGEHPLLKDWAPKETPRNTVGGVEAAQASPAQAAPAEQGEASNE